MSFQKGKSLAPGSSSTALQFEGATRCARRGCAMLSGLNSTHGGSSNTNSSNSSNTNSSNSNIGNCWRAAWGKWSGIPPEFSRGFLGMVWPGIKSRGMEWVWRCVGQTKSETSATTTANKIY